MTDRELMQQALEIEMLAKRFNEGWHEGIKIDALDIELLLDVAAALRERLAQPEQEPVAWVYPEGLEALKSGRPWTAYGSSGEGRIPLYLNDAVAPKAEPRSGESGAGFESLPASPTWWDEPAQMNYRKWQGLTGDEVNEFAAGCHLGNSVQGAIRKAEAKLREKNT